MPRADAQAEGDVLEHGHVPEQGVVLEHEADVPLADVPARDVLAVEQDRRCRRSASGISSPAMIRSSVVLPEPDGPEQRDQLAVVARSG